MKLIAIGDNVVDCYLDQKQFYPGGNCVNVAVQSKRNGAEKVAYIGIFGNDEKANAIKNALEAEGVTYTFSRTMLGKSGQPRVNLVNGDRVFIGGPKDTVQHIVRIKLTDEEREYASSFDVCHISVYSSMEAELPFLKEKVPISYDFSDEHEDEYLEKVCPYVTYAFFSGSHLSDEEVKVLANKVLLFGVKVVGVTKGGEAAQFFTKEGLFKREPEPTELLDTMGAGDSFIAGFLTEYTQSDNIKIALDKAAASSAETCKHYGGFGYPNDFTEETVSENK